MAVTSGSAFDVIVVGGGGSGLAAACSAAERGGRVLLLEKRAELGGTTGLAVGSFTGCGTSLQREAGVVDRVEDHAEDAGLFAPPEIEARNNAALRRFFLAETAATFEWLSALGLEFSGPRPEPPNRVPRMHNVVPGSKAYVDTLRRRVEKLGGVIRPGLEVRELIREGRRIVGVRASDGDELVELYAGRGVVLAAGDYAANAELLRRYKGDPYADVDAVNPAALGDGHRLAAAAGGRLLNMDVAYGPELRFVPAASATGAAGGTWLHPEPALFEDGAILVNRLGSRFTDETCWPERELALARQPEKIAYILLDSRLARRYSEWPHFVSTAPDVSYAYVDDYRASRPDITAVGPSVETLARRRGLSAERLSAAVAEFNRYVRGAGADEFGRTGDRHVLEGDAWTLLGPARAYFTTTEGGVAVDQDLRVLDGEGRIVPGLHAVGQNGLGGMILWGHGLHIAWALTSGRLAGVAVMGPADGRESATSPHLG